jgi:hypothetical protein
MLDKKRDFFRNRVFYRGNFPRIAAGEDSKKCPARLVQFLLMFLTQIPLPPQQETEVLLRQRL